MISHAMTADETEFRIEFTITRRQPGEDDFTEIGFGSSGTWSDLAVCTHMIDSAVTNGEWETESGQPDPESVLNQGDPEETRVSAREWF